MPVFGAGSHGVPSSFGSDIRYAVDIVSARTDVLPVGFATSRQQARRRVNGLNGARDIRRYQIVGSGDSGRVIRPLLRNSPLLQMLRWFASEGALLTLDVGSARRVFARVAAGGWVASVEEGEPEAWHR
jgi:hypothetical protein